MPLKKDDNGSAIIEVAIMLPIILMLVFGFIMFTHAVRINNVLEVAAREGARTYAATDSRSLTVTKISEELKLGGVDATEPDISIHTDGQECRVTVEMPYPIYVPFAGRYGLSLAGDAIFHKEFDMKYWQYK